MQRAFGAIYLAASICLSTGCYSVKINMPEPDEDPFAGTDLAATKVPPNEAPPPKNSTDPDIDFIKDMLRRSAEQAAKCDDPDNKGPRGIASVTVTFANNGRVTSTVVAPPHAGTQIGACITRAFDPIYVTSWTKKNSVTMNRVIDFDKKKQDPTP